MSFPKLFTPFRINGITLPNRLVQCSGDGYERLPVRTASVNQDITDRPYVRFAKGEVGLDRARSDGGAFGEIGAVASDLRR